MKKIMKALSGVVVFTAFRDLFASHVVVDKGRRFVTGQNQHSGLETAHKMMQVIANRGE